MGQVADRNGLYIMDTPRAFALKDVQALAMPGETEEKKTAARGAFARLFILKKTERISAVNALLEPHLTGRSDFRDILLKKTFSLYESVLALHSQRFGPLKDSAERVKDMLRALEGLYEIGRHGRVLEDETARLLIRECRALRNFVHQEFLNEGTAGNGDTGALIDTRMFAIERAVHQELGEGDAAEPYAPQGEVPHEPHENKETDIKDSFYIGQDVMSDNGSKSFATPHRGRHTVQPLQKTSGAPLASTRQLGSATMRHKDRRARILALLQKQERVSIKDVVREITDCSEKTIQRELAALVAQGVLKKEGERRWSTYTLA